jgi:hypothetical protein
MFRLHASRRAGRGGGGFSLAVLLIMAGLAQGAEPASPPAAAPRKNPAPEPADNSYCLVCHRNLEKEGLTARHQKTGVGCEQCHGMSEKHSSDEDGITPPEKMYSRARVAAFCLTCHQAAQLKEKPKHQPVLGLFTKGPAKTDPEARVCTDCHGKHRLPVRTRHWDKDTGKLVADDGVRMMDKSRPPKAKD